MLNGKATIILLKVGLIRKTLFPKPKFFGGRVKVKLDLSNYATKTDLQNAEGVDTSAFAKKTDLANTKYDVDKLDIDKLKNVPSALCNLKNKVDKSNIGKLETTPVELSKWCSKKWSS